MTRGDSRYVARCALGLALALLGALSVLVLASLDGCGGRPASASAPGVTWPLDNVPARRMYDGGGE